MGRNFGLDVARATAISAVLAGHGLGLFAGNVSMFGWLGYLGVELFFVLSGFLIGQILIVELVEHPAGSSLGRFYVRRWLRTLPAYFAVLALLALMRRPVPLSMLVFVQNFDPAALAWFPASWSLAVEEWFYLALPLLLLAAVRSWHGRQRPAFFGLCALVVALSFAARVIYTLDANPSWDAVRKQIPLRMDSLVIGVLLAGARAYHPALYARVAARATTLLSAATLLSLTLYWQVGLAGGALANGSLFARTGMFDVVSLAFAVLIAALERGWTRSSGIIAAPIEQLSRVSYSVYLVHTDAFLFVRTHASALGPVLRFLPPSAGVWASQIAALAITGLAAAALYAAVERPFMALRDRLVPSIGHPRARRPRLERPAVVPESRGL